jgi:Flp pilus assembly protein TadG
VLVEFALVMPIFVMLLLGIVTAGLAYNRKIDLTHATREGARYGATVSPYQQWQSGTWAGNVRDLVVARSGGELDTADVCVALVVNSSATSTAVYSGAGKPASFFTTKPDGTGCYADTYPQFSTNDNGLRVQVLASRPATIELALLPSIDVVLNSRATAKSENAA